MAEVNAVNEQDDEVEVSETELLQDIEDVNEETEVEAEVEDDESPKFDKEKFQRQNRELGNLRRQNEKLNSELRQTTQEISEIKDLLKARPKAENQEDRREAQDFKGEADDLLDTVKDLADDDLIPVSSYKKMVGVLGSLIKKANSGKDVDDLREQLADVRKKLERVEGETSTTSAFSKASDIWDETYPELEGQFKKFNTKAMSLARNQLGVEGNTPEVIGLATGYLNALAKKAKTVSIKPADRDNTAMRKPATSTKGASSSKSGANPAPDLDEIDTMDLRRFIMQNDPSFSA